MESKKSQKNSIAQKSNLFIIPDRTADKLKQQMMDGELVLECFNPAQLKDMDKAISENRLGTFSEIEEDITLKFPEEYASLIDQQVKDGKISSIIIQNTVTKTLVKRYVPQDLGF